MEEMTGYVVCVEAGSAELTPYGFVSMRSNGEKTVVADVRHACCYAGLTEAQELANSFDAGPGAPCTVRKMTITLGPICKAETKLPDVNPISYEPGRDIYDECAFCGAPLNETEERTSVCDLCR